MAVQGVKAAVATRRAAAERRGRARVRRRGRGTAVRSCADVAVAVGLRVDVDMEVLMAVVTRWGVGGVGGFTGEGCWAGFVVLSLAWAGRFRGVPPE